VHDVLELGMSGHAISFGIRPGCVDAKRGVIGPGTGKIKDLKGFLVCR